MLRFAAADEAAATEHLRHYALDYFESLDYWTVPSYRSDLLEVFALTFHTSEHNMRFGDPSIIDQLPRVMSSARDPWTVLFRSNSYLTDDDRDRSVMLLEDVFSHYRQTVVSEDSLRLAMPLVDQPIFGLAPSGTSVAAFAKNQYIATAFARQRYVIAWDAVIASRIRRARACTHQGDRSQTLRPDTVLTCVGSAIRRRQTWAEWPELLYTAAIIVISQSKEDQWAALYLLYEGCFNQRLMYAPKKQ